MIAEDARVLVDQKYAETDKPATLITKRSVTNSIGMRAYLQETANGVSQQCTNDD